MIYRFMWEEKSSLLCSGNTDSGREYRYEHLSFVCAQNMQSWKKVQNNLFGTLVLQDELLCFVENQRGIIRKSEMLRVTKAVKLHQYEFFDLLFMK